MEAVSAGAVPDLWSRRMGAAVRLLGVVGPLWLPLAAWALLRPVSPFAAAHAWREFRDGLIWKGLLLVLGTVSLGWTLARLVYHAQTGWVAFTWSEVAVRLGVTLLVVGGLAVWNLVQAIFQARAAWRGEWPRTRRRRA